MQVETEKERVSLLETLLQTQKELADASQQLERLRQDMKAQKLKEQVWRVVPSRGGEGTLVGSFDTGASVGRALPGCSTWQAQVQLAANMPDAVPALQELTF